LITEEVRKYAAEQRLSEPEDLESAMKAVTQRDSARPDFQKRKSSLSAARDLREWVAVAAATWRRRPRRHELFCYDNFMNGADGIERHRWARNAGEAEAGLSSREAE
jgi:hypothetical protein